MVHQPFSMMLTKCGDMRVLMMDMSGHDSSWELLGGVLLLACCANDCPGGTERFCPCLHLQHNVAQTAWRQNHREHQADTFRHLGLKEVQKAKACQKQRTEQLSVARLRSVLFECGQFFLFFLSIRSNKKQSAKKHLMCKTISKLCRFAFHYSIILDILHYKQYWISLVYSSPLHDLFHYLYSTAQRLRVPHSAVRAIPCWPAL